MSKILIIDDDLASCRTLQLHFQSQSHQVELAHSVAQGLESAAHLEPDLIVLDIRMPGENGLDGLPKFRQTCAHTPVIMITAFDDMDSTILAMKRGADDYITKPIDIDEMDSAVSRALMRLEPLHDGLTIKEEGSFKNDPYAMVGSSRAMKEVFKNIGLFAPKPVTVLITGPSGTGKEMVARNIHRSGPTPDGPFVAVNCAALVETLLESDMFGHEKGAFTGAISAQPGKFSLANNGTIFLDEVGELSPSIQAKLLRVIQEKEFIPVGGKTAQKTNARIIAATNVELGEKVESGVFREDLFYRLQVVNIKMPRLQERSEDLPHLVQILLHRINREFDHNVCHISLEVMDLLGHYSWPGNVRELENVLVKAVALCPGDIITADLLPEAITSLASKERMPPTPQPTDMSLQAIEKAHVDRVLRLTNWHRGETCKTLGISRPRLRRLINQYGLTESNQPE